MQVTIIGSGNVATVMGKVLLDKGHSIRQVVGRNREVTHALAGQLQASAVYNYADVKVHEGIYLLAVSDAVVAGVAARLSLGDNLLVHTAGSVSKEVLQKASTRYGVLWPMKMIRKNMNDLAPVTMVTDGNTEEVIREIEILADVFSAATIRADDVLRSKMHMVAAFTSNFSNHLYHLAADFCTAEKIDFRLFYPIIEATVQSLQQQHPALTQAGPAFRGDRITEAKHLDLLENYPQAKHLYELMSESIRKSFGA